MENPHLAMVTSLRLLPLMMRRAGKSPLPKSMCLIKKTWPQKSKRRLFNSDLQMYSRKQQPALELGLCLWNVRAREVLRLD